MELHQSAREQFEKVAASIRATLTAAPDRSPPAAEPSWQPDIHAPEITDADIFRLRVEGADGIRVGSKLLPRAAADELRRLSERLARALQSKAFVGPRAVFRHAQEWVFSSVKESFCEFCLARLGTEVRERTVWVPVACLHVESEFDIGPVRFRAISSADIDRWCEFRDAPPEARPFAEGERAKLKTEIQGYAAGTVNVVSDLDLADAIALDLVRDALAALRLFSPAADGLRARSYCVPHGMEHIERYPPVSA